MKKEFIPYPLALELKQLGFDEPCFAYYNIDPQLKTPAFNMVKPFEHEWCLSAPLYQQAFRWFREEHGVSVYISPFEDGSAFYYMVYTNINVPYSNRICSLPSKWDTYEEAELACFDKLIEIVESKSE